MRILTTIGTSLFTNYNKKSKVLDTYPDLKNDYEAITTQLDNLDEKGASEYENSSYEGDIRHLREVTQHLWLEVARERSCAELQTLYKIIKEEDSEEFEVYLLATDTVLSVLAAELIKEYLKTQSTIHGKKVNCIFNSDIESSDTTVIKGLQVDSADNFLNLGFNKLLEVINKLSLEKNTILNISGGYKALIPFLTLFAQIQEIPIKYNYEESDTLISVGSLPFHFDWVVVEALKPFLKNSFIEKGEIQKLGYHWYKNNIKFQNNKFLTSDEEAKMEIRSIPRIYHQVFNSLASYNLLQWDSKDNKVETNYMGRLLREMTIGSERGYIMELLLHKYFLSYARKVKLTKEYTLLEEDYLNKVDEQLRETPHFKIMDLSLKQIQLVKKSKEIGDIDVPLQKESKIVWGEAKAISAASDYKKLIGTKKDYYLQLKARGLVCQELGQEGENLFIVFRFVFKGINDQDDFLNDDLVGTLKHLSGLNSDLKEGSFKALGVNIPLKFKDSKIDFTPFYKGDFKQWKWTEL